MAKSSIVFVIDDETALRTAYAAALSKLGYTVKTASDGVEGQVLLKAGVPSLILLDMLMPNLDGVGFLKQLRGDAANKDVKIVVVSNFESLPDAEELGVEKYLSKMQNTPEAVAAAVDRVLKAGG